MCHLQETYFRCKEEVESKIIKIAHENRHQKSTWMSLNNEMNRQRTNKKIVDMNDNKPIKHTRYIHKLFHPTQKTHFLFNMQLKVLDRERVT